MPRKSFKEANPDWEPATIDEVELLGQIENGTPAQLIDEAARNQAAREEYESRQAISRLPKAYERFKGQIPEHALTKELEQIERMAYQGLRGEVIASRFGMTPLELLNMARSFKDLAAALTGGAARAADELSSKAIHGAKRGNDELLRWLLETRHGFVAPPTAPSVNVQIDGAQVSLDFSRAESLSQAQQDVLQLLEAQDAECVEAEPEENGESEK